MTRTASTAIRPHIGLLLIGGLHHALHLVPIASGLPAAGVDVTVFVRSEAEEAECRRVLSALGITDPDIRLMPVKPWLKWMSPKSATLLSNRKAFAALDASLVCERTSTMLRRLPRWLSGCPPLFLGMTHGAGDRAQGFDPRIRHFDHMLVPGEKSRRRMIALHLVTPETCHVTGYIKPYVLRRLSQDRPRLFDNDNPVVLYNPHFREALCSWPEYGNALLERFVATPEINFIVAPHMRLYKDFRTDHARVEAYGRHPNIHVDLGSVRSTDMTYTRAADIYLGDVSSQVYEFLSGGPKPCVFIGATGLPDWRGNPDFAHWTYGPVCTDVAGVMDALASAQATHAEYAAVQQAGRDESLGPPDLDPIKAAAETLASLLRG